MEIIVAISNVLRRELSSFLLSEAGYTVYEASDRSMLLRFLDKTHPAMILLDAHLNGEDCTELVQHIRQMYPIPIMLLTRDAALCSCSSLPLPGDDCLDWPFQADDLLAHVGALTKPPPKKGVSSRHATSLAMGDAATIAG
jgi:DNA-binding response OmpR family regulator